VTRFAVVWVGVLGSMTWAPLGCTRPASTVDAGATPTHAGSATASPEPSAVKGEQEKPRTEEEECRACNGIWGKHGLRQIPFCNCGTKDADKRCRDGLECEGQCVADDEPEREIVQAGPPPLGYFVGKCSAVAKVFGCRRIIQRGAAASPPHDLSKPLQKMCSD